jgi:hypothetical protein
MLAEVTDYELWQRAVRDQFREGESIGTVLLGVGCLVGIVVAILVIARVQARWQQTGDPEIAESHPQRLFTHLLCALGLSSAQRQLLEGVARISGLKHPASMLLSETLYDRSMTRWDAQADTSSAGQHAEERKSLAVIRGRLFPEGHGMVQSGTHTAPRISTRRT